MISPLELTQVYLDRIQTLDARLNSFFTVMAERATAEAKAKTEQLAGQVDPASLPAFFGVSIAIKDFVDRIPGANDGLIAVALLVNVCLQGE
ncbi:amidase family protein [Oscillatoria sp. FACHB-1407]|uniref:amidase family protein n=1 Tax=Oscillatoria sp. FACHB-1407 TaxID=2692847 RepID=UPI0028156C95|nr:amidase family protein [Oscillatoria sp. FACHB-1407]